MGAACRWARRDHSIRTFPAAVFDDNARSMALLERLGFRPERRYRADDDRSGKGLASTRMRLDL